jgi:tetratricopeptide (TPR) repeat protein
MNRSKTILAGLIVLSCTAFAQNKNVVSAINYLEYYKKDMSCDNLTSAKSFIDQAAVHADTKESAKMWYNRGTIYQLIAQSKDPKCKANTPNPIMEAVTSFQNCIKYDTKKMYEADVKQRLNNAALEMTNAGVGEFQNKNYANALTMFESAIAINKEVFNRIDTVSIYNAALASERAGNAAKAKEMYKKLIDIQAGGKDGGKYYSYLAKLYENDKDSVNYQNTVMAGRKAYPDDLNLILAETNLYLTKPGKEKEAITNLNAAIAKDPKNYNLQFALGATYEKMNDFDNAEKAYKAALAMKDDYFDALYNLGALYFNKGVRINEAANSIKDNAKYKAEVAKADQYFKLSLPYLEKAHEVNRKDKNTMLSLKQLYVMLEQTDKYNKINEELKN